MSVQAQYKLLMDVDSDESYRLSLPVTDVEFSNGMGSSYEVLANVTQLTAMLSNKDGSLTEDIFGDFTKDVRTEIIQNEQLENNSFTAWSGGEPTQWVKKTWVAGMTTSETASGGGAGTGALHVTGTGHVSYSQFLTAQRNYLVTITVSQFSGSGVITVRLAESDEFAATQDIITISAAGTHTFRMDVEGMAYFEMAIKRISGTFTVTIDDVSVKEVIVRYSNSQQVEQEVLGANIITNGDFTAWTGSTPTGWTTTDPTSEEVGSGQAAGGAGTGSVNLSELSSGRIAAIRQTVTAIGQQAYKFTFVVSYLSGTNAKVQVGSPAQPGLSAFYVNANEVGTFTYYLKAGGAAGVTVTILTELRVIGDANPVQATIDSLSIQPVSFVPGFIPPTETGFTVAPDTLTFERAQVRRGTLVKLLASYREIVDKQLWVGKLYSIEPTPSQTGEREVQIICKDPMEQFREKEYLVPYQENVRANAAIEKMLKEEPTITFPYASSFWILGVPGASEVGVNTFPYAGPPMSFDTGVQVIPFIGDNSDRSQPSATDNRDAIRQGVSQLAFINDLMLAEVDGRFFWDGRTSQFKFHNRIHDLTNETPVSTIENFTTGVFIGSDVVYSEVEVHYQPREVGAANSVLWRYLNPPLILGPGKTTRINVRYTDPDNPSVRVGAKDVKQLQFGVDYAGPGTGYGILSAHVKAGGNGAVITLANSHRSRTASLTTLQLRGTPIKTYQPESVTEISGESIYTNDPQPYSYRAQLISNEETAQQVARFLLARYGTAKRRFASITFVAQVSDARMRDALSRVIGDLVKVRDPYLHHDSNYNIVGEKHRINFKNGEHWVTFILKPQGSTNFWLLGDPVHSVLGVSTYPVL